MNILPRVNLSQNKNKKSSYAPFNIFIKEIISKNLKDFFNANKKQEDFVIPIIPGNNKKNLLKNNYSLKKTKKNDIFHIKTSTIKNRVRSAMPQNKNNSIKKRDNIFIRKNKISKFEDKLINILNNDKLTNNKFNTEKKEIKANIRPFSALHVNKEEERKQNIKQINLIEDIKPNKINFLN